MDQSRSYHSDISATTIWFGYLHLRFRRSLSLRFLNNNLILADVIFPSFLMSNMLVLVSHMFVFIHNLQHQGIIRQIYARWSIWIIYWKCILPIALYNAVKIQYSNLLGYIFSWSILQKILPFPMPWLNKSLIWKSF